MHLMKRKFFRMAHMKGVYEVLYTVALTMGLGVEAGYLFDIL